MTEKPISMYHTVISSRTSALRNLEIYHEAHEEHEEHEVTTNELKIILRVLCGEILVGGSSWMSQTM